MFLNTFVKWLTLPIITNIQSYSKHLRGDNHLIYHSNLWTYLSGTIRKDKNGELEYVKHRRKPHTDSNNFYQY
jgi:hypothetical protein